MQLDAPIFIDTCGRLFYQELEITSSHATQLIHQMQTEKPTTVETVTAVLKRAYMAHPLVNFATEFMAEETSATGIQLDEYFKTTGTLKDPLHGIPISVNEDVGVKDRVTRAGYVAWIDNITSEDALIVRLLKEAGAIFHIRTNESQIVMVSYTQPMIRDVQTNPLVAS